MLNSYAHKFSQRSVSEFIIRRFQRERNEKKNIFCWHIEKSLTKPISMREFMWTPIFICFFFQCSWRAAQVWAMRTSSAFAMAPISKSTTFRYWWSPFRCIFEYKSMAVCYPIDLDFFDYDVHFIFIWLHDRCASDGLN